MASATARAQGKRECSPRTDKARRAGRTVKWLRRGRRGGDGADPPQVDDGIGAAREDKKVVEAIEAGASRPVVTDRWQREQASACRRAGSGRGRRVLRGRRGRGRQRRLGLAEAARLSQVPEFHRPVVRGGQEDIWTVRVVCQYPHAAAVRAADVAGSLHCAQVDGGDGAARRAEGERVHVVQVPARGQDEVLPLGCCVVCCAVRAASAAGAEGRCGRARGGGRGRACAAVTGCAEGGVWRRSELFSRCWLVLGCCWLVLLLLPARARRMGGGG